MRYGATAGVDRVDRAPNRAWATVRAGVRDVRGRASVAGCGESLGIGLAPALARWLSHSTTLAARYGARYTGPEGQHVVEAAVPQEGQIGGSARAVRTPTGALVVYVIAAVGVPTVASEPVRKSAGRQVQVGLTVLRRRR